MSKKKVISFKSVIDGKFTIIDKKDIAETNERVKAAMKVVVREYEKNETLSVQNASSLILNA